MTTTLDRLDLKNVRLGLDPLTRARYERARSRFGLVQETEEKLSEVAGTSGPYIVRDIFGGLVRPSLSIDEETDRTPIRRLLDWATSELDRIPDWRTLQAASRDNVLTASLATEVVANHLASLGWPSPSSDESSETLSKDSSGKPSSVKLTVSGNELRIDKDNNGKKTTEVRSYPTKEQAEAIAASERKKLLNYGFQSSKDSAPGDPSSDLESFVDGLVDNPSESAKFRGAIVSKVRQANVDASKTTEALSVVYGDEVGQAMTTDPDEHAATIAEQVRKSKKLSDFLAHIGRLLSAMKSSPVRQRVRGSVMPYDIATTRDFRRLIPSELALFSNPSTRALQTVRVVSGQALGWEYAEMGSKSKGPIHVALDVSGSMQNSLTEAKAFAVASCLHAADNGRAVSASVFNMETRQVAGGLDTPTERGKFVSYMLGVVAYGGTDFRPLVEHIEKLGATEDVLLISDGVGRLDEDRTREVFTNRALHYLVLGDRSAVQPTLADIAQDRMITVSELLSEAVVQFSLGATAPHA
jgi:hypothetical protein